MEAAGVRFEAKIDTVGAGGRAEPEARGEIDDIRNTKIYHLNLLQKFGEKRCYLCGCDLEHTIIGSHIERVTDIKKSSSYTREEKLERATDGDNGFWLCANHDKMFEYGIIYFDGDTLQTGAFVRGAQQHEFIEKSIFEMRAIYDGAVAGPEFKILPEHYTARTAEYLELHKRRVA